MTNPFFETIFCSLRCAAVAVVLTVFAVPADAVVIYREIFPNSSGANQPLNGEGWRIHTLSGAEVPTGGATNSPAFSTPQNLPGINSSPTENDAAAQADGYAFTNATNSQPYLFWTSEYTIDRSLGEVTEISWYQSNQNGDASRAAVQIGPQWYVSQSTFANTPSIDADHMQKQTLDFATASWLSLDFVPGSSLALGAPTTLSSSNITAFGRFTDNKTAQLRMDTFQIDYAPNEPNNPSVTLAQYTFPQSNPGDPPNLTPTTSHQLIAAGPVSGGAGVNVTASGLGNPPGSIILRELESPTLAEAVTADEYLRVPLSVPETHNLALTALEFDLQRDTADQVTDFALYLENSQGEIGEVLASQSITGMPANTLSQFYLNSLVLSDIEALQKLSGDFALRLYFFGANSPGSALARLDNLEISGILTPVPEPATGILLAAGGVGLALLARRKLRA